MVLSFGIERHLWSVGFLLGLDICLWELELMSDGWRVQTPDFLFKNYMDYGKFPNRNLS